MTLSSEEIIGRIHSAITVAVSEVVVAGGDVSKVQNPEWMQQLWSFEELSSGEVGLDELSGYVGCAVGCILTLVTAMAGMRHVASLGEMPIDIMATWQRIMLMSAIGKEEM